MEKAKAFGAPMSPSTCLETDAPGKDVDEKTYRVMIGSLLYLTASGPDIMFSVCRCTRLLSAPKESHLTTVKRIIRYLIGTQDFGLWYPHSNNFDLFGYPDADFAGDKIDRKSTNGTFQILGESLIPWHSKEQTSIALSTTEAEYLDLGSFGTQLLWMMHQLIDCELSYDSVPIFYENTKFVDSRKSTNRYFYKTLA
ncbi:secreted RxLR effector protein 161-like [Lycium ferocissimum]|uniref:secreted RxLR effector protein 161-like n=1 Tax=Lycium ferocissimum TaxID=112874 RepID=UPI002814F6AB|nr:secreted RxLR effector protein 161-like [Lycium ferocissimum]